MVRVLKMMCQGVLTKRRGENPWDCVAKDLGSLKDDKPTEHIIRWKNSLAAEPNTYGRFFDCIAILPGHPHHQRNESQSGC
jgi:hypothetical protein